MSVIGGAISFHCAFSVLHLQFDYLSATVGSVKDVKGFSGINLQITITQDD